MATGIDDLADRVMPPVVESAAALDVARLRPVDGRVNLDPIRAAGPLVTQAADASAAVAAPIEAIDSDALLGVIARPVREIQDRVGALALTLRTGQRATSLLPSMLGADGPRRYLLLLQTNAELRATGGLPGVLCIITADDGEIAMTEQVAAGSMPSYDTPVLPLSPEDEALYTARLGYYIGDVNLTQDFPTAAPLAAEMWRRYTGETVDGVLATDPVALSYLLGATGPVDDGTGQLLTEANVVDVLLSEAYSRFPDPVDQNTFFAGVASNVFDALAAGRGSPGATVSALGTAAGEHRLLIWATRSDEEQQLDGTVLAGRLPLSSARVTAGAPPSTVGIFFNDSTGSKMDYYLNSDVELAASGCSGGQRTYTVQVTLSSSAPADAATSLPDSVTGPGTFGVPKGSVATNVVVVGPLGGEVASIELDGSTVGFTHDTQDGRPATGVTVELRPGERSVVSFVLSDPGAGKDLDIWTTPTRNRAGLLHRALDRDKC